MRPFFLIFILSAIVNIHIFSQEKYDSLQNINKENIDLMIGQVLVYPQMPRIKSNLFWKNKGGKIFKSIGGYYKLYTKNEFVVGKHFRVTDIVKKESNTILECIIEESGKKVYINGYALLETKYPYMYVEGHLVKLNDLYYNDSLYFNLSNLDYKAKKCVSRIKLTPYAYFKCDKVVPLNIDGNGLRFYFNDGNNNLDIEYYKEAKVSADIVSEAIKRENEIFEKRKKIQEEEKKKEEDRKKMLAVKFQRINSYLPIDENVNLSYIETCNEDALKRLSSKYNKGKIAEFVEKGLDLNLIEKLIKKYGFNIIYEMSTSYIKVDWNKFEKNAKKYGPQNAKSIALKQVKLGWSDDMVIETLGYPTDINTTSGSWGVHEQWVYERNYRDFGYSCEYYYFENGVLTSMQY